MNPEQQESRKSVVSAGVTESEHWALTLVARKTGRPLSHLMRDYTLTQLIEWGQKLDQALEELNPAA